jgi:hypothetical protein
MVHLKLRRVLAASALVAALSLVPVASANAAIHARAPRARVVSSRFQAGSAWLWNLVVKAFGEEAGVRIDPDGNP